MENTDVSNKFNIIAGAEWEFTNDWDCSGGDISVESAVTWDGSQDAINSRADCAQKCLDEPTCVAFNFPKHENDKCYSKADSQKSTRLGKDCGASSENWQYYTLLDRNPTCGSSGNLIFHMGAAWYLKKQKVISNIIKFKHLIS